MSFAVNLKAALKERGMTPYQFAKEGGFNQATVHYWVSGEREPSARSALDVAKFLGTTVESLMK